jgi:hypothetical protein
MYLPEVYATSAILAELPYILVLTFLFSLITYVLAGLKSNVGSFLFFYLGSFLLAMFFMAVALAYSSIFPVLAISQLAGGLSISMSYLFSGVFIPRPEIPPGWVGMYYAVPTSHVVRAINVEQAYCTGESCPIIQTPDGQSVTIYQYVSGFFQTTYGNRWGEMAWASVPFVVMLLFGFLAIRFINHQKR